MNAGERAEMNWLFSAWRTAPRLVMGQRLEEDLSVNVAEHLAADQRWRASDRDVAITLIYWPLSYTPVPKQWTTIRARLPGARPMSWVASVRPLSVGSFPFRCREDGLGFACN